VAWRGRELPIDHAPATLVLTMPGTAASR